MQVFETLKKNRFNVTVLLLAFILVANLFGGFHKLETWWKSQTDSSLVTDEAKWLSWLNRNRDLFSSLADGAQVGITKNLNDNYGLIWTKQPDGMAIKRTTELRQIGPGIILEFDDEVAKDLQWKKSREEAVIFLRHRSQTGKIQTYYLKKQDKLKQEGFLDFLREIGLRPS